MKSKLSILISLLALLACKNTSTINNDSSQLQSTRVIQNIEGLTIDHAYIDPDGNYVIGFDKIEIRSLGGTPWVYTIDNKINYFDVKHISHSRSGDFLFQLDLDENPNGGMTKFIGESAATGIFPDRFNSYLLCLGKNEQLNDINPAKHARVYRVASEQEIGEFRQRVRNGTLVFTETSSNSYNQKLFYSKSTDGQTYYVFIRKHHVGNGESIDEFYAGTLGQMQKYEVEDVEGLLDGGTTTTYLKNGDIFYMPANAKKSESFLSRFKSGGPQGVKYALMSRNKSHGFIGNFDLNRLEIPGLGYQESVKVHPCNLRPNFSDFPVPL